MERPPPRDHDPSVFREPHLQGVPGSDPRCARCGYSLRAITGDCCPECGKPPFEPADLDAAVDHTVWDEPALSPALSGAAPRDAVTYAAWLDDQRARVTRMESWAAVAGLSAAAGPWSIVGAFWGAGGTALSVLALVLFGPIVEEVMKVAAVTWAVERRPAWFRSGAQVILCCAMGGLVFAVIENLLYLNIYFPDPPAWLVWWRWTVCIALHTGCSLLAGLGLVRVWRNAMNQKRRPNMTDGYRFLLAAIALHAFYNTMALIFEMGIRAAR